MPTFIQNYRLSHHHHFITDRKYPIQNERNERTSLARIRHYHRTCIANHATVDTVIGFTHRGINGPYGPALMMTL